MRTVIGTLGIVTVLAAWAAAQAAGPDRVKIIGVGLDSTYAQVLKAFGKPVTDPKARAEECIGGREKKVEFDGLSFHLMDGDSRDRKTLEVKGFTVTSPKYPVSGLKIGDSEMAIRLRYGLKYVKGDDESGAEVWSYEFSDPDSPGFTHVYVQGGKVVKIMSAYMVC